MCDFRDCISGPGFEHPELGVSFIAEIVSALVRIDIVSAFGRLLLLPLAAMLPKSSSSSSKIVAAVFLSSLIY